MFRLNVYDVQLVPVDLYREELNLDHKRRKRKKEQDHFPPLALDLHFLLE